MHRISPLPYNADENMEGLSEIRQAILRLLKHERAASIAVIARHLDVTYEAARQQIVQMESDGWITKRKQRTSSAGRPTSEYTLTPAGDHLFPKHYDVLASELIATVASQLGTDALMQLLASITESQVRAWEPLLRGKPIEERLALLRDLYQKDDSFMEADTRPGELRLVERNCPFLNVATKHPALCSTSVNTLTRLLGYRVVREERFQTSDQRCVFRVLTDQPVDSSNWVFQIEPPPRP